ncbi:MULTISPECIES: RapZ C-terminal domain-containing protein [Streptomycetaceae]|nr:MULTISPECIES: RNase adapter RapZ [Streptomycetaceae]MYS57673.1 hypothetical protein [Streptomyces sp. SID5468]CCB73285.1 protein of unknown function [Streptantibioticus cattleyicolor NRRL 8057 = DSM 46488]
MTPHHTASAKVVVRSIGTRHPDAIGLLRSGLYFDLGHLRNPHADRIMRYKTGLSEDVRAHVLSTPGATHLAVQIAEAAKAQLYSFANRNQDPVTVTLACSGGRHRSVVMAEQVAEYLDIDDVPAAVEHLHIHASVIE